MLLGRNLHSTTASNLWALQASQLLAPCGQSAGLHVQPTHELTTFLLCRPLPPRSLLEPGEETLPLWMSDASPDMCGQLRLSAALALLRLARRHDTRLNPSTYCSLALMMQDELEGVRAAFAAKVYRLMRFFLVRLGRVVRHWTGQ